MDPEELADLAWDRAAAQLAVDDPEGRAGDHHLLAAMDVDGAIQANGIAQAWETRDVPAGLAGLRWFGLDDAADLIEQVRDAMAAGRDEDGEVDQELSGRYYDLDTESLLEAGLHRRTASDPDAFLQEGSLQEGSLQERDLPMGGDEPLIERCRRYAAEEPRMSDRASTRAWAALEAEALREMRADPAVYDAVLAIYQDGSDPALTRVLGSLVHPDRDEAAAAPETWWQHPSVAIRPELMPIGMALSLPVLWDVVVAEGPITDPTPWGPCWFGGQPAVPRAQAGSWEAPRRGDGEPLVHVLQVDLSEEEDVQRPVEVARTGLPADGMVQLFHDLRTTGWEDDTDPAAWAVRWVPAQELDDLVMPRMPRRVRTRDEVARMQQTILPLNPQWVSSIPHPSDYDLTDAERVRYQRAWLWLEARGWEMNRFDRRGLWDYEAAGTPWDVEFRTRPPLSRMGGHPFAGRTDQTREILRQRLPLASTQDHHVLLFAVAPSTYEYEEIFHGGRTLEVWIRASDLHARRFDQVWCFIRTDVTDR